MNGKDIFLGLGYIDSRFIEEAEMEELHPVIHSWKRPLLIAALVAVMLMLVGCSVAYAQGWFGQYFEQRSGEPLTQAQVDYLAQNEQIIAESQTKDQWTVELRSAITDGTTGYIIVGIIAPEGVNLDTKIEDGSIKEQFSPGNSGMALMNMPADTQPVLTDSKGITAGGGSTWREDGDGKSNTKNMVFKLSRDMFSPADEDPFSPDVEYYIHIENIVRQYEDQEYLDELLRTKYAGQTDYMLEPDETRRLLQFEVLAEDVWDFTVRFDGTSGQRAQPVELLAEPRKVMGYAYREGPPLNEFLSDTIESHEEITLTSVQVSPLSIIVTYACDVSCRLSQPADGSPETYVVMKDGSRVETFESGRGSALDNLILDPQAPIVLDEVDHILLPDGTKIPMPQ